MLHDLPPELTSHILGYLHRDRAALKAVALTCHHLLPLAREFLFAVMSYKVLAEDSMAPYLAYVQEIRLMPTSRCVSRHVLMDELFRRLCPQSLPQLSTFTFCGLQFWDIIAILPPCLQALSQFASVTQLTLSGMSFLNLRHIQAFVCSLPCLSSLNLHRVTYAEPSMARQFSVPHVQNLDVKTRPRLRRLAFCPDVTTRATSEIAEWLANSPAATSLETIVVPFAARAPLYVLGRFGRFVRHLSLPIRSFHQDTYRGQLEGYTDLHSLTLFMDSYNLNQGSWYLLAPFLERGVGNRQLRKVTIDVRIEFETGMDAVVDWAALNRLNEVLDDESFDALEEVEFILQLKEELGWDPAEEAKALLNRVEARLPSIAGAGKRLVTRYWRVHEFYDTITSLRTGVL